MATTENKELLIRAIESGEIPPSQYKKLFYLMGMIKFEPGENVLDNGVVLEEMIAKWVKLIKPEQLVGVLSALRDDEVRRNEILDRMISKAFEQSGASGMTEEEWRRKVERKLLEK